MSVANFVKVLSVKELPPGTAKQVELEEKGLSLAVCNVDGKIYAMDGMCSHVGGPLGEGDLDGNALLCPWHGWQFDVMTGACAVKPGARQQIFAVRVEGDAILVDVD